MIYADFAALFLPLLGALIAGFGGHALGDRKAQWVTCICMMLAAAASIAVFQDVALEGHVRTHVLGQWFASGGLAVDWAIRLDTLTAVMLLVVNVISAMVHIYAVGYMHGDKGIPRFMAYLGMFTFFMLMLVSADNLLQMFFGWEGVGLSSYLLIGFWFHKPSAAAAGMKAFIVNRIGDFGFLLGIFACFSLFNSIRFDDIFRLVPQLADNPMLSVACLLLFIGAMGKSAQLGLHTWLPDAMEGPTPVSALIHAATMVTAGVFMVARLSPMFEHAPMVLEFITVVGALTAIVAASIGITQFDIKRVIAYSTMSQLGYMFFALGVSAYSAAIFHLATHAFFKALLFLGAGSVIHALAGEQDMRRMGGLCRKAPITCGLMWIGSLALAGIGIEGVFGFAGFYSKDLILESALTAGLYGGEWFGILAYVLGLTAAAMTAFYSLRLLILVFHGKPRAGADVMHHAHESPWIMLLPLIPLAIGAIFAGWYAHGWFAGEGVAEFWKNAIVTNPPLTPPLAGIVDENGLAVTIVGEIPHWFSYLPLVLVMFGMALAVVMYALFPSAPAKLAKAMGWIYRLLFNKYYFDEIYDRLVVRPIKALGMALWHTGDDRIIDGYGPDGVARLVTRTGQDSGALQTGYLYHYAFVMVGGLVLLMLWFTLMQ